MFAPLTAIRLNSARGNRDTMMEEVTLAAGQKQWEKINHLLPAFLSSKGPFVEIS